MFQSSPAPEDWRFRCGTRGSPDRTRFNPRQPQRTGASITFRPFPGLVCTFQSSPAPEDWRFSTAERSLRSGSSFNPRQPQRTGASVFPFALDLLASVSILASPRGLALLVAGGDRGVGPEGFNPRQPQRTG